MKTVYIHFPKESERKRRGYFNGAIGIIDDEIYAQEVAAAKEVGIEEDEYRQIMGLESDEAIMYLMRFQPNFEMPTTNCRIACTTVNKKFCKKMPMSPQYLESKHPEWNLDDEPLLK